MWNYRIFFENLNLINKKYKLLNSNQENFNIFFILFGLNEQVSSIAKVKIIHIISSNMEKLGNILHIQF